MRATWRRLLGRLQGFRRSEQGVAAVEFALVVPIMLTLYIGSVEASALISMDRKLQSVAGALGDLVARSQETIPAAILEDYFKAASGIMTPHSTDELDQVVTQVRVLADGTTSVEWSWQYANGDLSVGPHADGLPFLLPPAMIDVAHDASKDTFVIVAEGRYAYPPLYGFAFQQTVNLYRQNFFMPRFGGSIDIE